MSYEKKHQDKARPSSRPCYNGSCSIVVLLISLLTFSTLALNAFNLKPQQLRSYSAALTTNMDLDHK